MRYNEFAAASKKYNKERKISNYLMDSVFSLLANLVMLALLVVMAYTLHRKRKLGAQ